MITDKELCQLCINSYKGKHGKVEIVPGVSDPVWYKKDHTEFYTCEDEDTFYVVFQGSNGSADWIDNLDFKQVELCTKPVKVHDGFLRQWCKISRKVEEVRLFTNKKIICTGHSLGGALATIASYLKNFDCVTFGSPKVGNKKFKKYYNQDREQRRYVFENDIVTKVPFRYMLFWKYYHVGEKIQLGKKTKLLDIIKHPIKYLKGSKEDHRPQNYLEAL